MNLFDKAIDWLGTAAAWLFFATGLLLTWEVVARYVFSAPTIWAAEISQMFLIWGMYIALPYTIARRENINIDILHERLPGWGRQICNLVSVFFTTFFCAVVFWYGWDIGWDSLVRGRSTGTMLNIPNWWTEMVIPLGFGLSVVVCAADLFKLARGKPPTGSSGRGGH